MHLKSVREPRPVGSILRAAPTSLYTPGSNDSSALSSIPAIFTSRSVTVSGLISSFPLLPGEEEYVFLFYCLFFLKKFTAILLSVTSKTVTRAANCQLDRMLRASREITGVFRVYWGCSMKNHYYGPSGFGRSTEYLLPKLES